MNDDELDALVASASPVTLGKRELAELGRRTRDLAPIAVAAVRHGASDPAVDGEDTSWDAAELDGSPGAGLGLAGRRRWALVPLAAVAIAVLGAVAVVPRGTRQQPVPASVAAAAAEAPRYLVDLPGWVVERVDELDGEQGEMTFANRASGELLDLRWSPVASYDAVVGDRKIDSVYDEDLRVAGHPARLFRYAASEDFTALWVDGDAALEARGTAADVEAYKARLGGLRTVSVDRWLAALPEGAVRPSDRAATVDEMLVGLPLPDGFDAEALRDGDDVKDEYQLGASVAAAVVCGWFDAWVAAIDAGDAAAAQRAVDAMATSPGWPLLRKMDGQGDYPEVVWEYAREMAGDGKVEGGKTLTIRESYADAFGCATVP